MPGSRIGEAVQAATAEVPAWTSIIRPARGWGGIDLRELWRYRDLVALMVRRDFVAQHAQTILGPIWFLLQPVLTTITFTLVFGRVVRLPTDGVPPSLFYLSGVVAWSYFATCVNRTSVTFTNNVHLFGKVWFPRLVVPISSVLSGLMAFVVQLGLLAIMVAIESVRAGSSLVGFEALALPLLVAQIGCLGLACGLVVSAMTTRYRDLANLVGFGVQLWMFATPVVYAGSGIPPGWKWLMYANPMAPVLEAFRWLTLGTGTVEAAQLLTSGAVTAALLAGALLLFGRVERTFLDTV